MEWNGMKNSIMQVAYFLNSLMANFSLIFLYIEKKWLLKRVLATILPLKSKLSGKS